MTKLEARTPPRRLFRIRCSVIRILSFGFPSDFLIRHSGFGRHSSFVIEPMWFKRTPKNRRLERGNVLDVKLRTKEVRAARIKLATTALGVSLGTVFALYLLWRGGVWALDRFVFKNDAFAVRDLDVQTDGSIPIAQLCQWAGVKPGDNLLALDLARIKRDIELAPMIESAAVERGLPHTLRVRVT